MQYIWTALLFLIVPMCGTALQGATGFGMALLCMTVLPFVFPLDFVSVTVLFLGIYSAAQLAWRLRRDFDWRLALVPLLFTLLFRFFGVGLISVANPQLVKGILGAVLILLSVYLAFLNKKLRFRPSFLAGAIAGSVSGFLGGMFNISGPPMVAYMFNATEDKRKYAACLQTIFFVGGLGNVVFRAFRHNLVTTQGPWMLVLALVMGVLGSFIGATVGLKVFEKLNRRALSIGVYSVMALSGLINILQAAGVL